MIINFDAVNGYVYLRPETEAETVYLEHKLIDGMAENKGKFEFKHTRYGITLKLREVE